MFHKGHFIKDPPKVMSIYRGNYRIRTSKYLIKR
jgi:hypothetical protein